MALQKFQRTGAPCAQTGEDEKPERRQHECRLIHNRLAKNTFNPGGSVFDWKPAPFVSGNNKSSFLAGRGIVPQFNAHMDLFGESKGDFIIYEMKSVNDESSNLLSQVRKAVSQLYEYRFIYGMQARLAIVTNKPVSKSNQWLVDYLEKDRGIGYQWTEDFQAFSCGPGSEGLAGPFCPK